jgi:hypothetical protein
MSHQSLFVIESAFSDLMEAREELEMQPSFAPEDEAARLAALVEVDKAIVEYVTAEVRKVDNIARYLQELKARIAALAVERERLRRKGVACERAEERIKEMVLQVMRDTDTKKLTGNVGTLRRQKNSRAAVGIVQPELVPDEMKRVTVTMPLVFWKFARLNSLCEDMRVSDPEPDLTAIREALEAGRGVPGCVLKPGEHLRCS